LAQLGSYASAQFAQRLEELKLVPAHAGILRAISGSSGVSQQGLASLLGMVPSRLVTWLDELEERGLIERRDHPEDRRLYALHLTSAGAKTLVEIGGVARAHDDAICAPLAPAERDQFFGILSRLAEAHNLTPGIHPGFAKMGDGRPRPSSRNPKRDGTQ